MRGSISLQLGLKAATNDELSDIHGNTVLVPVGASSLRSGRRNVVKKPRSTQLRTCVYSSKESLQSRSSIM
ncbi:uncharacterized protein CCR75_006066 [Bremia lactucae]|uniref:Uncharacterized protein n=1 Tax=Bremia lactucae TaxID=4779 RepID=A0A976IB79_BRELC|nr:hypothetical protein CCR75_006066 [Bremia lactucae]